MSHLKLNNIGRWEIIDETGMPYEVTSGDVIQVEVAGQAKLQATRVEFAHSSEGGGRYVSVDDYPLPRLRAA